MYPAVKIDYALPDSGAECLWHSANTWKHSAKDLPSVTPGKGHSVAIIPAKTSLPSAFCRALGKGFAECQGRHSAKKSSHDGVWDRDGSLPSALWKALGKDGLFAECLWRGTRQSSGHFAECPWRGTRQSSGHFAECFLYTLGKEFFLRILICFFPTILHRHIFTHAYYIFTQAYYLKFYIQIQIHASLIVTTKFNKVSSSHK
jgi:hypothetical protein